MELSKLEIVRGIAALISDESKWCKGVAARDIQGNALSPMEASAASFCIWGAARRVGGLGIGSLGKAVRGNHFWDVMLDIGQYNPEKVSSGNIGTYNDSHSYGEIRERLKEVEAQYLKEESHERATV